MYRVRLVMAGVFFVTSCQVAVAQSGKVAPQADEYVTKAYRVSDLIVLTPDYSFRGIQLPGLIEGGGFSKSAGGLGVVGGIGGGFGAAAVAANSQVLSQMGMGGQLGLGGGGMGKGGGPFGGAMGGSSVTPMVRSVRFSTDDLIEAITTLVERDSWDEVGGAGSITSLGGMLLVSQTQAVQEQISEFLSTIREQGASPRSITVRAFWVLVDSEQLSQLQGSGEKSMRHVDRKTLEGLGDAMVARGQLTCFDGQTVHVVSGRVRSSVTSVIPVVGQVDRTTVVDGLAQRRQRTNRHDGASESASDVPSARLSKHVLAQGPVVQPGMSMGGPGGFLASAGQRSVGYSPVISSVNFGVVLQVTPSIIPDTELVVLDLQSTVTRRSTEPSAPVNFQQRAGLDRLDLVVQQFKTTLRIPMGEPVLVAGATFEPPISTTSSDGQLYLVVEATLADEEAASMKK